MSVRSLIILLLATAAIQSCNQAAEQYHIQIDMEGAQGKWARLMALEGNKYVVFDSVQVVPGTAAIMSKGVEGVTTMYLTLENLPGSVQLMVENSSYTISGTMESPVIETESKAQNDLNTYNSELKPLADRKAELIQALRASTASGDQVRSDSLRQAYYQLNDSQDSFDSTYVADHPTSFASLLLVWNTYYLLDAEQLETALNGLDPSLRQMEEYKNMSGKLERMKAVAIGRPFTDFELATPEGGSLKVSDVHDGNVLLIDFWASWCRPCRIANPELVAIYHEYHDRGFDILGVSLDRDSASWVKAIADDNLVWNQISDLKYWDSEGAELYGVSSIPHAVLVDRQGIIRAKRLEGDDLRQAIESLL